jgi:hypothetical protein
MLPLAVSRQQYHRLAVKASLWLIFNWVICLALRFIGYKQMSRVVWEPRRWDFFARR